MPINEVGYLLDTSVLVDLLRTNSPRIRDKLAQHSGNIIGLSVITLCELQFGLEIRANRYPHLRACEEQALSTIIASLQLFPLTSDVVRSYAKVRSHLQTSGASIGPLDMLIAAHAASMDATLVTSNLQEFRRVPKLRLEDWR